MKERLKTIVDLEKYPIHDLNLKKIKELIKKCKSDLDQFSCATIPKFILPKSLEIMNMELKKKIQEVYMSKKSINAYLYSKDDPTLPKDHPKRIFMDRDNGYLNSDVFSKNSEMKFLYEQDELLNFTCFTSTFSNIFINFKLPSNILLLNTDFIDW